jgi:DUF4097 and DUF4098 domain-containing protein YvlB
MDSKNRNVWIVVIAVLVVACCCVLAVAAGVAGWLTSRYVEKPFDLGALDRERVEKTFEVGDAPTLDVTNFAGSVTIRPGEEGVVRVVATKKPSSRSRLERTEVSMTERDGRVVIEAKQPSPRSNASVDLEITAPAGSRVDVDIGAGEVNVRDITGRIDIHNGAGTVDVRGARGVARVDVGAGQITYEGAPSGDCRFETGAGEVILRLPADLDVQVDLSTSTGPVNVDFHVDGRVTVRSVEGVIGDGSQGSIYAHTGAGSVSVKRQ